LDATIPLSEVFSVHEAATLLIEATEAGDTTTTDATAGP
jgi:hypothetical protein